MDTRYLILVSRLRLQPLARPGKPLYYVAGGLKGRGARFTEFQDKAKKMTKSEADRVREALRGQHFDAEIAPHVPNKTLVLVKLRA